MVSYCRDNLVSIHDDDSSSFPKPKEKNWNNALRSKRQGDILELRRKLNSAFKKNGIFEEKNKERQKKNKIVTDQLKERLCAAGVIIDDYSMEELDKSTLMDIMEIISIGLFGGDELREKQSELSGGVMSKFSKWPNISEYRKYRNAAEFVKGEYDPERDGKIYYNDLRRINFRLYNAIASYKKRHDDEELEKLLPTINRKVDEEVREFSEGGLSLSDLPYKEADRMRKRIISRGSR